jgi:hypothetical protein
MMDHASKDAVIKQTYLYLNNDEIKRLPTDGAVIKAAPRPGVLLQPILVVVNTDFSAGAYSNISDGSYFTVGPNGGGSGYVADDSSTTPALDGMTALFGTATKKTTVIDNQYVYASQVAAGWGNQNFVWGTSVLENKPFNVYVFNSGGNFTGGNANNRMKITLLYIEILLP